MSTSHTDEAATLHRRLVQAIADPGHWTPRGDNYEESITSWSARAVVLALAVDEPADFQESRTDWATWAAVYKMGRDDAMTALGWERKRASERLLILGNVHHNARSMIDALSLIEQQTAPFGRFGSQQSLDTSPSI